MNREEALNIARAQVELMYTVPLKSNGYPVDGWKIPTPEERLKAVLEIAEFIAGDERLVAPEGKWDAVYSLIKQARLDGMAYIDRDALEAALGMS